MVLRKQDDRAQRFLATKNEGYLRFEFSVQLKSLEEQNQFFQSKNHQVLLKYLRKEADFLVKLFKDHGWVYKLSHSDLLEGYFNARKGFNHTLVFHQKFSICFIYGKNEATKKFVGVYHTKDGRFDIDAALKRYCLPRRTYTLCEPGEKPVTRTSMQDYMQLPMTPLNKWNLLMNYEPLVDLPRCMKLFVEVEKVELPK